MVIWLILKDSNGSTFVLSPVGGEGFNELGPLIVEDCTVVYARAHWDHWGGGALFNMRGQGGGEGGIHPHIQKHCGRGSQADETAFSDSYAR